jgi:hypothetical protein
MYIQNLKFGSGGYYEETDLYLLPFSPEKSVFMSVLVQLKNQNTYHFSFVRGSAWVWNFVTNIMGAL